MRIIVLANRAKASRPRMLQLRPDDIKMLTVAASRKAMLSAKSDTDRTPTANMHSRQTNKKIGRSEKRKRR